jgi:glycosyltransferase involved in cell wall biosynthesis
MTSAPVDVSVVFPCLNEEATLSRCIRAARAALTRAGLNGEVIVADNGSTDRSEAVATEEGARVVRVSARGYGNALFSGLRAARGRYLVHLDADMSYECADIPRFVEELRHGADLVMGSRLKGHIDPGAMPFLHRHVGTPVLTRLANLFFGSHISDINCGMRGLTKSAFERLGLRAGGMEFASEMVVKAAALRMNIVEIPTTLHPDARNRPPHLHAFRDGWRHLRFLLLFCPTWLFVWPGAAATIGGLAVIVAVLFDLFPYFGLLTCLAALAVTVLGVQTLLLGVAASRFAQLRRLRADTGGRGLLERLTLERGLVAGGTLLAAGFAILFVACVRIIRFMSEDGYDPSQLDLPSTKLALLGTTLFVTGAQIVFSSFFLGLFNIEPMSEAT